MEHFIQENVGMRVWFMCVSGGVLHIKKISRCDLAFRGRLIIRVVALWGRMSERYNHVGVGKHWNVTIFVRNGRWVNHVNEIVLCTERAIQYNKILTWVWARVWSWSWSTLRLFARFTLLTFLTLALFRLALNHAGVSVLRYDQYVMLINTAQLQYTEYLK